MGIDERAGIALLACIDEFGIRPLLLRIPPRYEWGPIVGDIVHNLRTVLDYLVWELTIKFSGPPPSGPLVGPWRAVQFPVALTAGQWTEQKKRRLWGIDPDLVARFEKLQPCYRRKNPDRHPLRVLEELWNRDKHRTLSLVTTLVGVERLAPSEWEMRATAGNRPLYLQASVTKKRRLGPFKNGAELARIEILNPLFNLRGVQEIVDMNLKLTFDIGFEQGAPAYGGRVISVLEDLKNRVTGILAQFQPYLR